MLAAGRVSPELATRTCPDSRRSAAIGGQRTWGELNRRQPSSDRDRVCVEGLSSRGLAASRGHRKPPDAVTTMSPAGCPHVNNFKVDNWKPNLRVIYQCFVWSGSAETRKRKVTSDGEPGGRGGGRRRGHPPSDIAHGGQCVCLCNARASAVACVDASPPFSEQHKHPTRLTREHRFTARSSPVRDVLPRTCLSRAAEGGWGGGQAHRSCYRGTRLKMRPHDGSVKDRVRICLCACSGAFTSLRCTAARAGV